MILENIYKFDLYKKLLSINFFILVKYRTFLIINFLTFSNALIGIYLIFNFNSSHFLILYTLAFILDGFDGLLARLFNVNSSLGKILDSVSDSISFGFLPSILLLTLTSTNDNPLIYLVSSSFFIFSILREFRVSKINNLFIGYPNTLVAYTIVVYLISNQNYLIWLLILPIIGMGMNFKFPTLEFLRYFEHYNLILGIILMVFIYVTISLPIIPIYILNIYVVGYMLYCIFTLLLFNFINILIVIITKTLNTEIASDCKVLKKGVYAYFIKDIVNLIFLSKLVQYDKEKILIIVGNKLGGKFLYRFLKHIGFEVLMINNKHNLSWRLAFLESKSYDHIFISANGPIGPDGLIKKGCKYMAKFLERPLYLITFKNIAPIPIYISERPYYLPKFNSIFEANIEDLN